MSDSFQVTPTPLETIPNIIEGLNATFESGKTFPIEWRKVQLKNLWRMVNVKNSVCLIL
jgi:aldehyde dehydrogenase (NAD+)